MSELPFIIVTAFTFTMKPNDQRIFPAQNNVRRTSQTETNQFVIVTTTSVSIIQRIKTVLHHRMGKITRIGMLFGFFRCGFGN
jgi:hypothetical protein